MTLICQGQFCMEGGSAGRGETGSRDGRSDGLFPKRSGELPSKAKGPGNPSDRGPSTGWRVATGESPAVPSQRVQARNPLGRVPFGRVPFGGVPLHGGRVDPVGDPLRLAGEGRGRGEVLVRVRLSGRRRRRTSGKAAMAASLFNADDPSYEGARHGLPGRAPSRPFQIRTPFFRISQISRRSSRNAGSVFMSSRRGRGRGTGMIRSGRAGRGLKTMIRSAR